MFRILVGTRLFAGAGFASKPVVSSNSPHISIFSGGSATVPRCSAGPLWQKPREMSDFYFIEVKCYICTLELESVQDFLIKLNVYASSIFSLNIDIVRLTKIMCKVVKDLKILSFKVIFQCLKLVESFQKKKFCEEYLIRRPTFINEIFWKLWFLKYFIY